MSAFYVIFLVAIVAAVLADIYDVVMTEKGIKASVGIEANAWLVGTKPSSIALYLRDSCMTVLVSAPALLVYVYGIEAAAYGLLAAPLVIAVKHYLGGRAWAKLLAGGKPPDPNAKLSWWQKFLQG